jgi:ankyrin repeat protein
MQHDTTENNSARDFFARVEAGLVADILSHVPVAEVPPILDFWGEDAHFRDGWPQIRRIMRNTWPALSGVQEVQWAARTQINMRDFDIGRQGLSYGTTMLGHLCFHGDVKTVEWLLERSQEDPNAISNYVLEEGGACSGTALIIASYKGNTAIVSALLSHEAIIVDERDNYSNTPLIWAAHNGHTDIATMLCGRGADVNAVGKDSDTPLIYAAQKGHTDIATMLCGRGADVNAVNQDSNTPLIFAAYNGHTDIATMLCGRGADVNAVNKDSDTPLIYAACKGHTDIAALLRQHGAIR